MGILFLLAVGGEATAINYIIIIISHHTHSSGSVILPTGVLKVTYQKDYQDRYSSIIKSTYMISVKAMAPLFQCLWLTYVRTMFSMPANYAW